MTTYAVGTLGWAKRKLRDSNRRSPGQPADISPEEVLSMYIDHNDLCDLCQRENPGGCGGFHLDHDHDTGQVRGLLCINCNRGLGLLGDTKTSIYRAYEYVCQGG